MRLSGCTIPRQHLTSAIITQKNYLSLALSKDELDSTVILMRCAMAEIQKQYGEELKSEEIQHELAELKERSSPLRLLLRLILVHRRISCSSS